MGNLRGDFEKLNFLDLCSGRMGVLETVCPFSTGS